MITYLCLPGARFQILEKFFARHNSAVHNLFASSFRHILRNLPIEIRSFVDD